MNEMGNERMCVQQMQNQQNYETYAAHQSGQGDVASPYQSPALRSQQIPSPQMISAMQGSGQVAPLMQGTIQQPWGPQYPTQPMQDPRVAPQMMQVPFMQGWNPQAMMSMQGWNPQGWNPQAMMNMQGWNPQVMGMMTAPQFPMGIQAGTRTSTSDTNVQTEVTKDTRSIAPRKRERSSERVSRPGKDERNKGDRNQDRRGKRGRSPKRRSRDTDARSEKTDTKGDKRRRSLSKDKLVTRSRSDNEKECKFFKNGLCKKGKDCSFKHTAKTVESQPERIVPVAVPRVIAPVQSATSASKTYPIGMRIQDLENLQGQLDQWLNVASRSPETTPYACIRDIARAQTELEELLASATEDEAPTAQIQHMQRAIENANQTVERMMTAFLSLDNNTEATRAEDWSSLLQSAMPVRLNQRPSQFTRTVEAVLKVNENKLAHAKLMGLPYKTWVAKFAKTQGEVNHAMKKAALFMDVWKVERSARHNRVREWLAQMSEEALITHLQGALSKGEHDMASEVLTRKQSAAKAAQEFRDKAARTRAERHRGKTGVAVTPTATAKVGNNRTPQVRFRDDDDADGVEALELPPADVDIYEPENPPTSPTQEEEDDDVIIDDMGKRDRRMENLAGNIVAIQDAQHELTRSQSGGLQVDLTRVEAVLKAATEQVNTYCSSTRIPSDKAASQADLEEYITRACIKINFMRGQYYKYSMSAQDSATRCSEESEKAVAANRRKLALTTQKDVKIRELTKCRVPHKRDTLDQRIKMINTEIRQAGLDTANHKHDALAYTTASSGALGCAKVIQEEYERLVDTLATKLTDEWTGAHNAVYKKASDLVSIGRDLTPEEVESVDLTDKMPGQSEKIPDAADYLEMICKAEKQAEKEARKKAANEAPTGDLASDNEESDDEGSDDDGEGDQKMGDEEELATAAHSDTEVARQANVTKTPLM